jgi:dTDP-4-amino-4,6-dideoxygalactose transaminase
MNPIISETTASLSGLPVKSAAVPFLDVRSTYLSIKEEMDAALAEVLESGAFILGPAVDAFENDFAGYLGVKHCVGLSSGLDALHIALLAAGVRPGDEVLVPANTYIATWLAVSFAGAVPVPVEPDPRTYNIDPARIEEAITPRTRGIVPVHLYGQPADMDAILEIARRKGLWVVEDAAQAHGARYKGRRVGGMGDVACWSFYPGKNLGAFGDGGAITTNRSDIADRAQVLRNYGQRVKYVNEEKGFNCRLDSVQAAVLRTKLAYLDEWNSRRRAIAAFYTEALEDTDLILPWTPRWVEAVHHVYVVRSRRRDALQDHLKMRGIGTVIHYPIPPHLQAAYSELGLGEGSLPITEAIHREALSLPMGPHLTMEQAEAVVESVREFCL